ncbi:metal-dependent hydrolase [Haladaptatus cibarius]|uniref:metal-dependent hydrolase n=1 Tax=Haladaptatus cibarius TaxID=453847 RepID=UPI0006789AB2|nr:metal-dependent hydrolase [Haladaptatus cibarius]
MVDVSGHFGMALLFAAPAWAIWGRRGAIGFTAFALVTSMLPDVDLALRHVLPVSHHGITHTFLFVAVVSVLCGAVSARFLTTSLNANRWIRSTEITGETVFVFATAGLLTGGISHIFADLLSAPDIAAPLSPLWPVYSDPIIIDVIYYDSPLWNFGLLAVAIGVHLVLAKNRRYPLDTRYRLGEFR